MRKRLLVMCAVSCLAVMGIAGSASAAGSPDAAQACQNGGYLTMIRADGNGFKNTGDCVSYYAQTNKAAACAVTATTGCLTFANVVMTDGGFTLTVDAAYSFDSTCNDAAPTTRCSNYAVGGGTYKITDPTGAVYEQGTLGTGNSKPNETFLAGDGSATTCAKATSRRVVVFASTPGDLANSTAVLSASTGPDSAFFDSDGLFFSEPTVVPGVTLSC